MTGASRGIGKQIALELARNGYRVAVNYFDDPASMVDAAVRKFAPYSRLQLAFRLTSAPALKSRPCSSR